MMLIDAQLQSYSMVKTNNEEIRNLAKPAEFYGLDQLPYGEPDQVQLF